MIQMIRPLLILWLCLSTSASFAKVFPIEAFSQLPDVSGLTLSPDGKHLAALVRVNVDGLRGTALTLYNLETATNKTLTVSENEKYRMDRAIWANDSTILIAARFPYTRYGTKVIESRLIKVDVKTGEIKPTLPSTFLRRQSYLPVNQSNIVSLSPDNPNEILLGARFTPSTATQVYRIDLKKSTVRSVQRAKSDVWDWIVDRQNNIRIAEQFEDTTTTYLHRNSKDDEWEPLYSYEALSADELVILGFDQDPDVIYYSKYHNDKYAIFKTNLSEGFEAEELVYSDENYDVYGGLVYSYKSEQVIGLYHGFGEPLTFWSTEHKNLQKSIDKALPNTQNAIIDMSRDERKVVIMSNADNDPGVYYVWDRDKGTMRGVAERYGSLDPAKLSSPEFISYTARDGVEIEAVLTKPIVPSDDPLPTIIFPHGGPISHDAGGFDVWTQYFANKGFAVLQMNFRGSSGYGFNFMAQGLDNWGGTMQLDVEDGTQWLIDQGISDPNRICIVGASYGGYAALMEAAADNQLYQCAVSFAGVTDLPDLLSSERGFISYQVAKKMIGDDRAELKRRSPTQLAEQINIPVLLVHGDKDRVVDAKHSRKMARALKRANKPHSYLELENGTHYLTNEENRMAFFYAMDEFLDAHLGTQ